MKIQSILATKGTDVITIHPNQTIREATANLVKYNIGALVVVDESDKMVGIISERDIIRQAAQNESFFNQAVSELMTHKVITGLPQDDVESAAATMTNRRIRHLPILDKGDLIGIVSIGDLMKAQIDQYRGEVDTLQTQISED